MKQVKIPFWMQIVAILLAGVLVSGAAFWIARGFVEKRQNENLEKHTVTFAYQDGTVIETKEVTHGKGTFPPQVDYKGVFRGWNVGFNAVEGDIETHPVYHIIQEDNLFYFDSVYVQEGKECSLDVKVGGQVSISSGELILEYDPEVLEFLGDENGQKCTVREQTAGTLILQFSSDEPIREEIVFSQLRFLAKERNAYSTEVILKSKNVKIIAGGQELPADHATINNKVYFLQEVG